MMKKAIKQFSCNIHNNNNNKTRKEALSILSRKHNYLNNNQQRNTSFGQEQIKCFSSSLLSLTSSNSNTTTSTTATTQASSKFPTRPVPAVSVTLLKLITRGSEVDGFKVLMIRRGKAPGKDLLALPGGHLNLGERMIEGAKRELQEETGINADLIHFTNAPLLTVESIYYHQEGDDGNETTSHNEEEDIRTMKISTKSNEINFRKELGEELTRRKREGDDSIQIQYHFIISSVLGIVPPELNHQIEGEPSDDASQIQWIKIMKNGKSRNSVELDEEGCITTHMSEWMDERNHRGLCEKLKTIYTMPIVVRHAIMRLISCYPEIQSQALVTPTDLSLLYQLNDMMVFYPIRDKVLEFWFQGDMAPQQWWFKSSPTIDQGIKKLFESHVAALSNKLELLFEKSFEEIDAVLKKQSKETLLSAMIMLDQFPRNMYRNSAKSFAFDDVAVKLSLWCIENQIDQQFEFPLQKIWFYFPLEHAEDAELQDMSCELFGKLVEEHEAMALFNKYAINHREVIQKFGRFPYRNKALGRESTPEEIEYLESQ
ncbi:predicted protein [Naegleria gruberi]|uniref:Predicted protein n=2 Tax=Naegleria gruberi TaxID=5762 RepID=D2V5P2_NAEGR|nr:uncharacterized protein NAEGRDRAFT_64152 [Naegleria gruberi]EFC47685.1 predicted protein [Naegleria gruberi]|eukprot:XP_002680429.1 predicted protein [Naegleria gruberi strain NEG-M]